MYVNLGRATVLPVRDVVGIFDLDNATWSHRTRAFLERAEREGRTVWLTGDLPRSFILTGDGKSAATVYISPLSSAVLANRAARDSFE